MNIGKAEMLQKALDMLGELAPEVPCEHLGTEYCEHLCKTDECIYAACWAEYIHRLCVEDAKKGANDIVIKMLDRIEELIINEYVGRRELGQTEYREILAMVIKVRDYVLDIAEEGASSGT